MSIALLPVLNPALTLTLALLVRKGDTGVVGARGRGWIGSCNSDWMLASSRWLSTSWDGSLSRAVLLTDEFELQVLCHLPDPSWWWSSSSRVVVVVVDGCRGGRALLVLIIGCATVAKETSSVAGSRLEDPKS